LVQKRERKPTGGRTRPIAVPSLLARSLNVTVRKQLTGDIEVGSGLGRESEPVAGTARVPAGVADLDRRHDETPVGVDGRATGRRHSATVVQPVVRHVVRKRLGLAAEFDATAFHRRRVARTNHDVRVAWRPRTATTTHDQSAIQRLMYVLMLPIRQRP